MANRRWITREEIAEIHESIARKALRTGATHDAAEPVYLEYIKEFQNHNQAAADIRQIESVGNFRPQMISSIRSSNVRRLA